MGNNKYIVGNRIWWIDYAKIFGLVLVILAHLYTSEGTSSDNTIRTYIYGFHMPFFFFISGMLFKHRDGGLNAALVKNVKSLLVPYLLFNLFFAFVYGIYQWNLVERLIKIPVSVVLGTGNNCKASWFVICLFFIKCIYDLLSYYKVRKYGMAVIIVLSLFSFQLNYFFFSSTILGLVFYHLGCMCKRWFSSVNIPWWGCLLIGFAMFVLSYFLTEWNGKVSLFGGKVGHNVLLFYLNALVGSFGIIWMAMSLRSKPSTIVMKASVASIGVVMLHMAFVDICKSFSGYFSSMLSLLVFYLVASLAIYAICAFLYHLTNRFLPIIWGKF